MTEFDSLYGNEKLKKTITGFVKNGFPNSLIVSGQSGSGKSLVSKLISMSLACKSENAPCGECRSCRKIREEISPDIIKYTFVKDRKTIGVESVRALKEEAYISPNDLDIKVYIISPADKMTEQAQNALLKIFEEGPKNVYFILECENAASLLTTVRSRAPELKTQSFSYEKLSELLLENEEKARQLKNKDEKLYNRVLSFANGSYGKALEALEGGSKKAYRIYERAEELLYALSEENLASILNILMAEANEREGYCTFLSLVLSGIRDLCAGSENAFPLLFSSGKEVDELKQKFSLQRLVNLSESIEDALITASTTNVNVRTSAINLAQKLDEIR